MEITLKVKSITLIVKFDSAQPITVALTKSCICASELGKCLNCISYLVISESVLGK